MIRLIKTNTSVVILRFVLGWLFFYSGITKVVNPEWSAKGFLENASTFSNFYSWLASPGILPITNFLNQWGLTLIGVALILGVLVRLSSYLGALMMILYYFPGLTFPYVGAHSLLVDEHIIYVASFIVLASLSTNHIWSPLDMFKSKMKK